MNKNNTAATANNGQTANNNTTKVKTPINVTERRKIREEQFRNFRINALKRRCKRYGFDDEKTAKYVEILKKQLDEPKQYSILIMYAKADLAAFKESLNNAKFTWKMASDTYMYIDGDQAVLAKIREIAPASAKIHPYTKKMESVIPVEEREVIKKPSNNTAEKKAAAKAANKGHTRKSTRYFHRMSKGRKKAIRAVSLAYYKRSKKRKVTSVQLDAKKSSTGLKKASTNLKKAA